MKIFYKAFLIATLLFIQLLTSYKLKAQVTIGDIAFTGYNSSPVAGSDDFTFIILRTGGLPANTVINFTDCGWLGNLTAACNSNNLIASNGTTETDIAWTSPASVLAYGTQVRITGLTASVGTVTGLSLSLSGIGDQLFAFTGVRTAPTFIAGIQMNVDASATATAWDNIFVSSLTASNRPSCLTDGIFSVWLGPSETDNAAFKCGIAISTIKTTALAQINNAANWDKQDAIAYVLPRSCVVLPIKLISFQAKNNLSNVILQWMVADEQSLSHYEIERSFDGNGFAKIGSVNPLSGDVNKNYRFIDFDGSTKGFTIIYYRLKSIDLDQKYTYSAIIKLQNEVNTAMWIDKLQNPIVNNLSFTLISRKSGIANVQILNINGKVINEAKLNLTSGRNNIIISETARLAKGIYCLCVTMGENIINIKLVK